MRPSPHLFALAGSLFVASLLPAQSGPEDKMAQPDVIIVDRSIEVKASPLSMEEEMRIYVDLEKNPNTLYIHPNPSSGVLWLEHRLRGEVYAILTDAKGIVRMKVSGVNVRKLDLRSLAAGEYSLEVHHDDGVVKKKMLLK